MKPLITLIILLSSFFLFQDKSDLLIGKWKCYHKELQDGTTKGTDLLSGDDFEYSCDELIIELKSDLTGWESLGEQNFNYKLKDSILTLGNKYYVVELINQSELILREYTPNEISINFRRKFERIK